MAITCRVTGITCQHCVNAVATELSALRLPPRSALAAASPPGAGRMHAGRREQKADGHGCR